MSSAIERLGTDDPARLLACWGQARQLADQNWDAIIRVAEALQRRGWLSGAAVDARAGGVCPSPRRLPRSPANCTSAVNLGGKPCRQTALDGHRTSAETA